VADQLQSEPDDSGSGRATRRPASGGASVRAPRAGVAGDPGSPPSGRTPRARAATAEAAVDPLTERPARRNGNGNGANGNGNGGSNGGGARRTAARVASAPTSAAALAGQPREADPATRPPSTTRRLRPRAAPGSDAAVGAAALRDVVRPDPLPDPESSAWLEAVPDDVTPPRRRRRREPVAEAELVPTTAPDEPTGAMPLPTGAVPMPRAVAAAGALIPQELTGFTPVTALASRRILRRFNLWTVLKVSMVLYSCMFFVGLVAALGVWSSAQSAGVIDDVESFMVDLGFEDFELVGDRILQIFVLIGALLTATAILVTLIAALLYNLISELIGGVEVTVLEQVAFLEQRPRNQQGRRGRRTGPAEPPARRAAVPATTGAVSLPPGGSDDSTIDRLRRRTVRRAGPDPRRSGR
jgi:hypothetical protein